MSNNNLEGGEDEIEDGDGGSPGGHVGRGSGKENGFGAGSSAAAPVSARPKKRPSIDPIVVVRPCLGVETAGGVTQNWIN
jgi:hypothetical protein